MILGLLGEGRYVSLYPSFACQVVSSLSWSVWRKRGCRRSAPIGAENGVARRGQHRPFENTGLTMLTAFSRPRDNVNRVDLLTSLQSVRYTKNNDGNMATSSSDKPDYANLEVLQRNRLPARSYWIPPTSLLLNGEWDFHYVLSPLDAPDLANQKTPNLEKDESWTSIAVPGHWQLQGHGRPHYTNTVYPFPSCPPNIPSENPTGTYKRSFKVPAEWDSSSQLRLRFDGVDSAYHVWLNGELVGYSQGSRNPAEFDITAGVKKDGGENELVVQVYQWCEATYIEDQDQWWLSGKLSCLGPVARLHERLTLIGRHLPRRHSTGIACDKNRGLFRQDRPRCRLPGRHSACRRDDRTKLRSLQRPRGDNHASRWR